MEENIIKKRAWFVIALIVAGIIMSLPAPDGLTPAGHKAIALLVILILQTCLFFQHLSHIRFFP